MRQNGEDGARHAKAEAMLENWSTTIALDAADATLAADERQLAALMQDRSMPIVEPPAEKTWIWSDLHTGATVQCCTRGTARSAT